MAQAVNLLIHRAVFLNERIGARDIGFGLIIIIIRDEIFHRIIGEEALKFRIKLRREGFIRRHNQGRALGLLDDFSHSEGLTGTRHAEQNLIAFNGV